MKRSIPALIVMPILALLIQCKMPNPPDSEEFTIYGNHLSTGFDIGVESSEEQRDWLHEERGFMKMAYPSGNENGSVFVVTAAVAFAQVAEDFSNFSTLAVDLRGESGNECIRIAIEDLSHSFIKPHFIFDLTTDWQTYLFSLNDFGQIDLRKLHVIANFLFSGKNSQIVYFKNLRYLSQSIENSQRSPFYMLYCNAIPPGYDIFMAKDSLSINPNSIELDIFDDTLNITFPRDNAWAVVFLMHKDEIPQDLSDYDSVEFEFRGERGDETVHIGMKDVLGMEGYVKIDATSDWVKQILPLTFFKQVDFSQLLVVFSVKIIVRQSLPMTIYLRSMKYIPKELK